MIIDFNLFEGKNGPKKGEILLRMLDNTLLVVVDEKLTKNGRLYLSIGTFNYKKIIWNVKDDFEYFNSVSIKKLHKIYRDIPGEYDLVYSTIPYYVVKEIEDRLSINIWYDINDYRFKKKLSIFNI